MAFCIPSADLVNDGLHSPSVHVIRTIDEIKSVRIGSATRIRVQGGEVTVCVLLKDDGVSFAMQDQAAMSKEMNVRRERVSILPYECGSWSVKSVDAKRSTRKWTQHLHIGHWADTCYVVDRGLEISHIGKIFGIDDVLFLLTSACDVPSVKALLVEPFLKPRICLKSFLHLPSARRHNEIGHPALTCILFKFFFIFAEVHPRDHGTARMTHDEIDGVMELVMQVADDGGKILNVIVEAAHRPVSFAVSIASEIESVRVYR